jgi:hypothetical protein
VAPQVSHELRDAGGDPAPQALTGTDARLYSGVGALHCRVDGRDRLVTAFLVGAFDVVVTVAHAFEGADGVVGPSACTFVNTDAEGRIVERIPVAEFQSRWADEPLIRGSAREDVAVARLERRSEFAQHTLAFRRPEDYPRDVAVVGYRAGVGGEWLKGKSPALADLSNDSPQVIWSGQAPESSASGAPVVDIATGAVIGINQARSGATRGALLEIDDWLARAILSYVRSNRPEEANGG